MAKLTGKKALVKVSGSPLTLTNEATTDAGDHINYQITNAAKRVMDPTAAVTVKENGVATSAPYTLNRLNGTVTFQDTTPIFVSQTVADASWANSSGITRTAAGFSCTDGVQLDLVGDNNAASPESTARAIPFTGNGAKDIRFRIAKSSAYASHQVIVYDPTAIAARFQANIDFTGATPVVTAVTGTVVSVTARGDGSFDVYGQTTSSLIAANPNEWLIYPAYFTAADVASFYIGLLKAYDSTSGPRGAGVAVTVSGSYLPTTTALHCTEWDMTLTGQNVDVTDFDSVGGFVERLAVGKDASGSVKNWRDTVDRSWENALIAGTPIVIALYTLATGNPDFLVWALLSKQQVQAALRNAQTQALDFEGAADADNRVVSAA